MSCDTYRDLLALRLYDELERDEAPRLAAHLSGCADCRALADELERGLGRLRPPRRGGAGAVGGARGAGAPRRDGRDGRDGRDRRFGAPHLAASFAAGLLAGLLALAAARAGGEEPAPEAAASAFRRADPPPEAERPEGIGVLATWLRR